MSDAPIRRKFPWKTVGIVAGVLVAILIAALFWVRSITAARWERLHDELQVQAQRERDRDHRRPVLRGTPVPGNAWDDYRTMAAEVQKVPKRSKLNLFIQRDPKTDPADVAAAVQQGSRALELLSQGAAKDSSNFGFEWEKGFSVVLPGLADTNQAAMLAVLKARALEAEGKRREAAALLLDASQYGRDLADDGPLLLGMVGLSVLQQSFEGLRELTATADAETLADLERSLAILDTSFPGYGACLRREHLGMAWSLIAGNEDMQGAYRGFGFQLVYLKAYDKAQEYLERSARASEQSWSESQKISNEIQQEAAKSWNPITKTVVPGFWSVEKAFRERLAQLRMLRAAVHYRRTGESLDLDDPFGAKLLSSRTESSLKVWSVGVDGVDHGGKGDWKASPGPDIVLDVKK